MGIFEIFLGAELWYFSRVWMDGRHAAPLNGRPQAGKFVIWPLS